MTIQESTQAGLNELIKAGLTVDGDLGSASQAALKIFHDKLSSVFNAKGYDFANLVGIRMSDDYTNQFTDWGAIFTGTGDTFIFPMSTKPGSSYQKNDAYVAQVGGCACLAPGQYKDMWSYRPAGGWSGDQYLMQVSPCKIYRDKTEGGTIDKFSSVTGMFGINFHSWRGDNGSTVDNLSAGCQVMDEIYLNDVMPILKKIQGNISYTLIDFSDFNLAS
jgi:hypothetical protein